MREGETFIYVSGVGLDLYLICDWGLGAGEGDFVLFYQF